jgi:uncharacterized membrane protein
MNLPQGPRRPCSALRPDPPASRYRQVSLRLAPLLLALALGAASGPVSAQFAVCNQTLDPFNLAIGRRVGSVDQSEGWWTIGANRCVDVIKDALVNRYIYVYALDVFGQPILEGDYEGEEFCISRKRFLIEDIGSCWERGHEAAKFMIVDTQEQARWTLFLKEPSAD